jgi:hypothetical protein
MGTVESQSPVAVEQDGPRPSRWRVWFTEMMAGRGWASLVPMLLMGGLLLCGSSFAFFLPYNDVAKYQCYAHAFWFGGSNYPANISCDFLQHYASALPFHTLPREYPALALIPFSLTLLVPQYWSQLAFAICITLAAAGLYWYLGRVGPRGAALAFAAFIVLGGWGTTDSRFDLVPAAFTLFCVVAAVRGRFIWAYVLLAVAVMLKLYPLPLLLPLFLGEQRAFGGGHPKPLLQWKRLLGVATFATTCAGIFLASLLVSVQGALGPLTYFADRPIQVESAPASILWVGSLLGHPICTAFQFGSLDVFEQLPPGCGRYTAPPPGPLASVLSLLFLALLVVGVVCVAWFQWRGKLSLPQACVALLFVIILTGKVFSPQYFIWLAPLVAYAIGLEDLFWFVAWCVLSLLTTIIYPYLYGAKGGIENAPAVPAFYPTIAYRNLLLAVVVICYVFDVLHLRSRSAAKLAAAHRTGEALTQEVRDQAGAAVGASGS